jgi:TIR domain
MTYDPGVPILDPSSRVFLSHNRRDKRFSRQLAAGLGAHGISVWFDEWSVGPGESIGAKIEQGLDGASHFLLVWSSAGAGSPWVTRERQAYLHRAIGTPRKIIPLMRDDTPLPALLADLKGVHVRNTREALDALVGPGGSERAIREAVVALNDRRKDLLRRDMAHGGSRCAACGSNAVREYSFSAWVGGKDELVSFTQCEDCGEDLGQCV